MTRRPPRSPLFPYPPLFRSRAPRGPVLGGSEPPPPPPPLVVMLQPARQRRHGFIHPQLADQLRHVAHHEPFPVLEHVDELLGALGHLAQRVEHAASLARRRRGDEPVDQQLHRSEEHTSELQSRLHLVCRLLLEKKKNT